MIELAKLEEMFDEMRSQTPWNVDGPLLWGYFFTDPSQDKLEMAAKNLKAQGYRFVRIHKTDDGSTNVLHIERVETHSPQTLFARNEELYRLAHELGLESYDGMDVGPAPH
ncbi:MAG: ribonuclease E inhibitor RraB [Terracidiphilus sp.]